MEAAGKRPKKRCGLYLEQDAEEYGFLVADMSPRDEREVLVEFKPKWVVQSPSAPEGWRRCRTCALRARKAGEKGKADGGFCPLDLASGDRVRVARAVEALVPLKEPKYWGSPEEWELKDRKIVVEEVTDYLTTSELMPVLKRLNEKLDPDGPLRTDMGKGFLDAMTVRDATVFLRVKVPKDGEVVDGEKVECGIADLDMKTGEAGKREYWRETERNLVEEGWYLGKGMVDGAVCRV